MYEILGAALSYAFPKEIEETRRGYKNLSLESASRRSSAERSPGMSRRRSREARRESAESADGSHPGAARVPSFDPASPGRRVSYVEGATDASAVRRLGTVKFFNCQKGYGFIIPRDAGSDIFVHYSVIMSSDNGNKTLVDGDDVEYVLVQGPKGAQASNVTGIGGGPVRGGDPLVLGAAAAVPPIVFAPSSGTVSPQYFIQQPFYMPPAPFSQQPMYYQYVSGYPPEMYAIPPYYSVPFYETHMAQAGAARASVSPIDADA